MKNNDRLIHYAVFALGLFTLATTVLGVWHNFSPIPAGDSWDGSVGFYIRALQHPWSAFFEQHNEHRLTFSRLFFFADVRYFGARNVLTLIVNLAVAGILSLAFFCITVHHWPALSRKARMSLAGIILTFVFSWIQKENYTWGFQSQWFAVYLFALLAFHSLERSVEASRQQDEMAARVRLAAALLCGSIATFSMSSGLLVLPILLIQAIYLRLSLTRLLTIVIVTVGIWVGYFTGWHSVVGSTQLSTVLHAHPFGLIQYVLLYLGAPAFNAMSNENVGIKAAYICGSFALMAILFAVYHALLANKKPPRAISLLAFVLFVGGNAALTAGGRLWFGLESALASRYTTASLTAWLALIIFFLIYNESDKLRKYVLFFAAVATLLVAYGQRTAFVTDNAIVFDRLASGLAVRYNVFDFPDTVAIYPVPANLARIAKEAQQAKLSIFAPNQHDYLVPPSHVSTDVACLGVIDDISPTETRGIYRASGWAFNRSNQQVQKAIVITDSKGETIGTGIAHGQRDDVAKIYGNRTRFSGWKAYFKMPADGQVRVDGLGTTGTYCTVGTKQLLGPRAATQ